jgi:hypothetical protein
MAIVSCAAAQYCGMPIGSGIELKKDGSPRHKCMHCRLGMCGAGECGFQWVDTKLKAEKGFCIVLTDVHPDGQREAEAFNNDGVLMCTKCAKKLSKAVDDANNFDMLR